MASCRRTEFFYRAVPLKFWRGWLVRQHIERCPACQARLASREEVRRLMARPEGYRDVSGLWARLEPELARTSVRRTTHLGLFKPRWQFALGLAAFCAAVGLSFWLLRAVQSSGPGPRAPRSGEQFALDYIRVGGAPAQAFIYQPSGSKMVFVWAEKSI
jgi:anti-sigma factor RsiW